MESIEQWKSRGNDAFRAKDYQTAMDCYTQGIKIAGVPNALNDSRNEIVGTLFSNRSACHLELGNANVALKEAESAVNFRPEWHKAHIRMSAAYEALGQMAKSLKSAEKAVRLEPTASDAVERHARLASSCSTTSAPNTRTSFGGTSANGNIGASGVPSPDQCTSGANAKEVGNTFFVKGEFAAAEKYYTKAIDLTPPHADPENCGIFYCNRAACHQNMKNFNAALKDSNAALAIGSKNSSVKALVRRANALEGLERFQEALDDYKQAEGLENIAASINGGGAKSSATAITAGTDRCKRALQAKPQNV